MIRGPLSIGERDPAGSPEAESLLDGVRSQTGAEPRPGMPAHVTLLYPFAPDPDAGVVAELGFFFAGVDGFALDLQRSRGVPRGGLPALRRRRMSAGS